MIYSIDQLQEKVEQLENTQAFNTGELLKSISELVSSVNTALQWRTELPSFSRIKLENVCHKLSLWLVSNMYNYSEAYVIREKLVKTVVLLEDPSKYNPFVWGIMQ